MATLVKDSRNRSPHWICCYTAADGRRLKKSTKQTNRKSALEVCLALERAEALGKQRTFTEARARELLSEVLQRTSGEALQHFTAEQWLRQWVTVKAEAKADRTGTRYKQVVDEFVRSLAGKAARSISAITPKDVLTFRQARRADGLTATTVNLDVTVIGGAFASAKRLGYVANNPCTAIEPLPEEKLEKATFSPDHIRALMQAAIACQHGRYVFRSAEDWRGLILLAFYTGARLQDGANMRWESIDLQIRVITYTPRKTSRKKKPPRVTVPIHPELEIYLLSLPAPDTGKAFLFPTLAGSSTGGRTGLSRTFARIMARAKIASAVVREANKRGRTVHSLSFHSLRHSFSSAMANAGVAEEVRMKLIGHSTRDVHQNYTHHELEPLRAAIARIPTLGFK
jgi:integrase